MPSSTPYSATDLVLGAQTALINLFTIDRWAFLPEKVEGLGRLFEKVNNQFASVEARCAELVGHTTEIRKGTSYGYQYKLNMVPVQEILRALSTDPAAFSKLASFVKLSDRVTALEEKGKEGKGKEEKGGGMADVDDREALIKTIAALEAKVDRLAKHVNLPDPDPSDVQDNANAIDLAPLSIGTDTKPATGSH